MSGVRVSVYLSEELHAAARRLDINVSEVCQRALREEIDNTIKSLQAAIDAGERARVLLQEILLPPLEPEGDLPGDVVEAAQSLGLLP
jgi:Post-segregation antitoxin CcdA